MTAPTIAKRLRFTGSLASPICHDLSPEVGILSRQASPNFRVGPRLIAHNAVIRVYDEAGNVIETHEHAGDFKEDLIYVRARCLFYFLGCERRRILWSALSVRRFTASTCANDCAEIANRPRREYRAEAPRAGLRANTAGKR